MDSCTYSAEKKNVEKVVAFAGRQLKGKGIAQHDSDEVLKAVKELFSAIADADQTNGPVIIKVENTPKGIGVQFMHAGPIFNPCPSDPDNSIRREMDEISFEFKYGRNVLTVFRRKNEHEVKDMKGTIEIKGKALSAGTTIAVVDGAKKEDVLAQIAALDASVSAVEWRIDSYDDVFEIKLMPEALSAVRAALGEKALMYTFRDKRIGGAHPTSCMYATRLNNLAIKPGEADMVTVEWYNELDAAMANIINIHEAGKLAVASWCDSEKLPSAEAIEAKLTAMLESGADVLEYGAVCKDEAQATELMNTLKAFKAAHEDAALICSAKNAEGKEIKTIL